MQYLMPANRDEGMLQDLKTRLNMVLTDMSGGGKIIGGIRAIRLCAPSIYRAS